MKIEIPVRNSVEVIVANLYVNCDIHLQPYTKPRTVEGELAIQQMQVRLNEVARKLSKEIMDAVEDTDE